MQRVARRRTLVAGMAAAAAWLRPLQAQTQAPLELGVVPHLSTRTLLALYRPLREHLQLQLRRDVQLSTAAGWTAFHQRTMSLGVDAVVTAAHLARLAQVDGGWLPQATFMPPMAGLLVAARARPLRQLADLRGATLGLANAQSLVALRGLQWLAGQGLKAGVDFQLASAAHDDSMAALLLRGDCAAALMSGGELKIVPDEQRARLQPQQLLEVPGFLATASPRLPAAETAMLQQAWLSLPATEPGRAFLSATGFVGAEPATPALMSSLDGVLPDTRRLLQSPG